MLDVVDVVGEVTVGDTTVVVGKSVVDVVVLGNSDVGDELVVVVLASVPVVSDDAPGTAVPTVVDDDAVVSAVATAR